MAKSVTHLIEQFLKTAASLTRATSVTLHVKQGNGWHAHTQLERCSDTGFRKNKALQSAPQAGIAGDLTSLTFVAQTRECQHLPRACATTQGFGSIEATSLFVPLIHDAQVNQILELTGDESADFGEEKRSMLVLLGDQAQAVIGLAQHYAELQNRSVAIEESMDGMAVLEQGRFTYLNRAHVQMFGYDSLGDLLGQSWKCLYRPEQIALFEAQVFPRLQQDGSWRGITVGLRKDGTTFHEEVTLILHPEGQLVCICRDITERLNAEQTIKQKSLALESYSKDLEAQVEQRTAELTKAMQLAEQANHAKGRFLANMSHELRTPLNGVLGMLTLLEGTHPTGEQQDYIRVAQKSGTHLLAMISDVLDFSKIDAGKLVLETANVKLRDVIEDAVEITAYHAFAKGLEIVSCIADDLPPFVCLDAGRLRQILLNLLNNAIKFTEQGEVSLTVQRGPVGTTETLQFEVRDTGIGLDSKQQSVVFNAFAQIDHTTSPRQNGAGLGLTICKGLLRLMGGNIEVESTPGAGSTFRVLLPMVTGHSDETAVAPLSFAGLTAVLVDPHAPSRRALRQALEHLQVAVMEGKDWDTTREQLSTASAADLMFLDAALVHGVPTEQLRQTIAETRCRLVLMTRLGQTPPQALCGNTAMRTLTKPLRWNQLQSVLENTFSSVQPSENENSKRSSADSPPPSYKAHVLVVDDVETNVRVLRGMLHQRGCTTDAVTTGTAAVQAVNTGSYDLITMDCQMPGMDGLEATARIRLTNASVPIVAVTAGVLAGEKTKCLAAGMNDYLAKPIDSAKLDAMLDRWLQHKTRASTAMTEQPASASFPVNAPMKEDLSVAAVDQGHIDMLLSIMSAAEFDFLVASYAENARQLLAGLTIAHRSKAMEAAVQSAHKLAGASATMGVTSVSNLCKDIERLGRADSFGTAMSELIARTELELHNAVAALKRMAPEDTTATHDGQAIPPSRSMPPNASPG